MAGLIPAVPGGRSGGVRAPRVARLRGVVAGRRPPAHQEADDAVDDHQRAEDRRRPPGRRTASCRNDSDRCQTRAARQMRDDHAQRDQRRDTRPAPMPSSAMTSRARPPQCSASITDVGPSPSSRTARPIQHRPPRMPATRAREVACHDQTVCHHNGGHEPDVPPARPPPQRTAVVTGASSGIGAATARGSPPPGSTCSAPPAGPTGSRRSPPRSAVRAVACDVTDADVGRGAGRGGRRRASTYWSTTPAARSARPRSPRPTATTGAGCTRST